MAGVDILASAFNGANAAFIADLYARWVADPAAVDPSFAELFARPERRGPRGADRRDRRLLGAAPLRGRRAEPPSRPPRRRRRGRRAGRSAEQIARRDPGQPARADADPRLPRARPSGGQARPARPAGAASRIRNWTRAPTASPRPTWTGRSSSTTCWACETRDRARDPRHAARDLLRPGRRRVHAHPGPGPEGLDPAPHRGRALARRVRRRGQDATSCSS